MAPLFTRAPMVGSCGAMVAVGGMAASYGPVIPELQARFQLSEAAAGAALSVQVVGTVIGVLIAQPVLRRWGNRATLVTALSLIVAGAMLIALAPSWPVVLAGAAVAGLGIGGCDPLITQLFILGLGSRSPRMVNIVHGCFGIGTVAAPFLVAGIGAERYPLVFGSVAFLAVLALSTMRPLAPRPTPADSPVDAPQAVRTPQAARLGAVIVGGLLTLYIAHFAVQFGIGNWLPTRLLDLGHSSLLASLATSGYWLMMVIGRFSAAALAHRISPTTLVTVSTVGMTGAILLAFYPPATIWAYLLAGLFIGPIFPNGLTWLTSTGYAQGSAFAYVIAAAMVGGIVCPPVIGALIDASGTTGALAPALLVGALIAIAAVVFVRVVSRRELPRTGTAQALPAES